MSSRTVRILGHPGVYSEARIEHGSFEEIPHASRPARREEHLSCLIAELEDTL